MDSDALLTFVTINQAKSFSRAAAILRRTQPAISRRIALLEEQLGMPVFERANSGVVLSEVGRALLPHAERVLAALRDAESAMEAMRAETAGRVSIAAVGTLAGTNLTTVLKRFAAKHPKIELTIRTATSAEVSDIVKRGEATLGLRYLLDPSSDIVSEHIASEGMVIACSREHRFAGKKLASLAELRDEPWFAFPNAFAQRETFADNIFAQFQACGIGSIKWTPIDSLTAKKRLIEAGLGLALLAESTVDEELRRRSLSTITVAGMTAVNPIHAIVRKSGYLSPAARRLLTLLRNESGLAGKPPPPSRRAKRPARKRRSR
ncbi:MAG TPA: LysR family transcriptional regulator [Polyangiales bacterium]|nr:LysR family transcriptional regulator [Polyangiales bacterium]